MLRINRCTLLYREQMNDKVLLCSIENYTRYPVTSYYGEGFETRQHAANARVYE